ncbi:TPA: hypothetical protein ACGI5J_000408 [Clostridioides difficile]|uniref:Conjugative transposon protein n=1 Tax=Clostridioides difficile TaxID=1496 RepID=A0AB74QH22_CLODI|nr:hypothetical protein [Clostridioides difficile]MCF2715146.1 hypothetical protein [Clostridioides difficile]MCG3626797.1 hypothetical protein [Clostridioides difficile]MCI9897305.1 hypothetical protein [Clostridioides difficile]MDB3310150.1 hypothetical protein [Clostridioides difficile]MDB3409159.1 hypothetical protein [Clostridioides difficile]
MNINDNKKKTYTLFIIVVLMFFLYTFLSIKEKSIDEKQNKDIVEVEQNENKDLNEENNKLLNEENNIEEKSVVDIGNKFIKAYHENLNSVEERLEALKSITDVDLYESIENELLMDRNKGNGDYQHRVIKQIHKEEYESQSIESVLYKVKVYSNWLNKDNKVTQEDITRYSIILVKENDKWIVADINSEILSK